MTEKENATEKPPDDDAQTQPPVEVNPRLPRLPPASDVLAEETLVSPKGNRFRVVTSKEVDATDKADKT
jgi:hypothetical protein